MHFLQELNQGISGIFLGYGIMLFPMIVLMVCYRASLSTYFKVLVRTPILFLLAIVGLLVIEALMPRGFLASLLHVAVLFGTGIAFIEYQYRAGRAWKDVHVRGARVFSARPQLKAGKLERHSSDLLTLAGIQVPPADETKHFKFIGTTGSGKSTAIRELMDGALERGDRAIIADPDGGYMSRFYDPGRGDIILNPFEPDSHKWDLFSEIQHVYDVDQLASGIIPSVDDASGREWRGYARTFLTALLRRCHADGRCDTQELRRLLAMASSEELRPLVADTAAQPFLEKANARMFGSIRSVAVSAAAALEYVQAQEAVPFSVREWVRSGTGVLFVPYQARQIAALRCIIATWMRLAIFEAMSQPENQDQRLWFVVDELDALGAIDGLKDALARLRKFGGRCILGFQSIAQVSSTYGAQEAQTIVENCSTSLILRCSASEGGGTAEFASKLIGDRDVERTSRSHSRSTPSLLSGQMGSSVTIGTNTSIVRENAVMPSEIEQLPDLHGYLKFSSNPAWMRVVIPRN